MVVILTTESGTGGAIAAGTMTGAGAVGLAAGIVGAVAAVNVRDGDFARGLGFEIRKPAFIRFVFHMLFITLRVDLNKFSEQSQERAVSSECWPRR
jgi:hypothetical protein